MSDMKPTRVATVAAGLLFVAIPLIWWRTASAPSLARGDGSAEDSRGNASARDAGSVAASDGSQPEPRAMITDDVRAERTDGQTARKIRRADAPDLASADPDSA